MDALDMDAPLRSLLGKLGLSGIRYGLADEAETVFAGLRALDETRVGPIIGLAQVHMVRNNPQTAAALLEGPAATEPEAALYYGVACSLMGNNALAESVWRSLAEGDGDTAAAARALLNPDGEEERADVFSWLKGTSKNRGF